MKTLAEFLARRIIDRADYFGPNAEKDYEQMIEWYGKDLAEGLEAYKEHLQEDSPKTAQWAMIERGLITALEKMQCHKHLNEKKIKYKCQNCNFEFNKPKLLKFLLSKDALACPKCDSQEI